MRNKAVERFNYLVLVVTELVFGSPQCGSEVNQRLVASYLREHGVSVASMYDDSPPEQCEPRGGE